VFLCPGRRDRSDGGWDITEGAVRHKQGTHVNEEAECRVRAGVSDGHHSRHGTVSHLSGAVQNKSIAERVLIVVFLVTNYCIQIQAQFKTKI